MHTLPAPTRGGGASASQFEERSYDDRNTVRVFGPCALLRRRASGQSPACLDHPPLPFTYAQLPMTPTPDPDAPVYDAVLTVAASRGRDAVLRFSEHDLTILLDEPAANLLRALAERARDDATRRRGFWGDSFSLQRAYQRVFNASTTTEQLHTALAKLESTLRRHGLRLELLVQKNRKTGDFRLSRPLQINFGEAGS